MGQKLKRSLLLLTTLSLFSAGAANAGCHDDSCTSECNPCGSSWLNDVRVSGEFLYWKPCFEGLDYGLLVDDTTGGATPINGKVLFVDHNWKPGFRVGLGLDDLFCGWNVDFDFARVVGTNSDSQDVETVNGAIYSSLYRAEENTAYQSAESEHTFTYMDYNILFSRTCCFKDCHNFRPYVGVAGVVINQKIRADFVDTTANPDITHQFKWDADYTGTGLRFGSGYDYQFNSCLSFFFDGSFALVYGTVDTKERFLTANSDQVVTDDFRPTEDECLFVPGFHISLGFNYDICWCGRDFGLFLGYEFQHWANAATPRRYVNADEVNRAISTSATTGSLGFHGIRVGASIVF